MTSRIVESILTEAKNHAAKKVLEVHITIGEYTFLNPEQVSFWYGILAKETPMEGSRLVITEKTGVLSCRSCGYLGSTDKDDDPSYHFSTPVFICPNCGQRLEIKEGKECTITKVRLMRS